VSRSVDLFKFALLFSALYAAFGVASPFLPEFLLLHGVGPERLGLALSLATTIRLISAPLAGRIADRLHALRIVLAICAAMGGAAALVFLPAFGFPVLLFVALCATAREPKMNASDPRPRTHPYSNLKRPNGPSAGLHT
jgi:PPP family 3-phenylpropionic acid transporter